MTKSATGAHLPGAAESLRRKGGIPPEALERLRRVGDVSGRVKTGVTTGAGLFERLVVLPGLDVMGFIGAAWTALEKLEPAEPDNKLFVARFDAAKAAWEELQAKAEPTGQDFDKCLELIAAAAIATQEDASAPAPREDDKPPATITAAYAARKPAPTKPTKPAARVVKPANPLTTAGARGIYSARRNLSK